MLYIFSNLRLFLVLLAVLVIWLMYSKRKKQKKAQNLKQSQEEQRLQRQYERENLRELERMGANQDSLNGQRPNAGRPQIISTSLKSKVIFNYNGHSWDAYEALGVPIGSSLSHCQSVFNKLTRDMDTESLQFYTAALQAIEEFKKGSSVG